MPSIRILPDSIANKIAAGEVIERPASVVKELLENSLDAQATQIDVAIEDGGKRLIRVSDNGIGMDEQDLALAFASHATSKLSSIEDLFAIRTLGFRGEALASVGAVSQARIISRPRGAATGAEVTVNGGKIGEVRSCGAAEGTIVEVRNLFFNVPVRRKFLKSPATEMGHIMEVFTRIALCYPTVRLSLYHNEREVLTLPPVKSPAERMGVFFGHELPASLVPVEYEEKGLTVSGYVAPPNTARLNAKLEYVFLNGRYIRDRFIFAAIAQAYRGLLMQGRYPVVFIFLKMDPSLVDVNVHPTKVEVRFREPNRVFHIVQMAIEEAIRGVAVQVTPPATPEPQPTTPTFQGLSVTPQPREESVRRAMADFFAKAYPKPEVRGGGKSPVSASPVRVDFPSVSSLAAQRFEAFQLHNSYIVEATPDGILITDQHALHERIILESLQTRVKNATILRQRLLVPAIVHLSASEFQSIMELQQILAKLGIEITDFGQNTVAVHAMPQMLDKCDPAQFVRDILDELGEGAMPQPASLDEKLRLIIALAACKGAVKAGQPLTTEEIHSLLEQRARLQHPSICAHGRPASFLLSFEYLQKQFARR